jgi:phosphoenolpyruvate carboxykinase (ATP)
MYHFLSGYTSKLAGTERGLGKEPVPNFSACFGEPFLPRHPQVYAKMLGDKMQRHRVSCWLVNTGWIGGPYGIGERMSLPYTRAMVNAAIEGKLNGIETHEHPVFKVKMPLRCPGVPSELLDPAEMWPNGSLYEAAARDLAARFRDNFRKFGGVDPAIAAAAPET